MDGEKKWAIALHGGAGVIQKGIAPEREQQYRDGLAHALSVGVAILENGGSALDASEATVRALEDCPLFNAGKGAVFTCKGEHEFDAAIMDGRPGLKAGAVACARDIKNPITLARRVMERTPHVLLVGNGAVEFARTQPDIEFAPPEYFYTQHRYEQLLEAQKKHRVQLDHADEEPKDGTKAATPSPSIAEDDHQPESVLEAKSKKMGTVGAVCRDVYGNLAAATSTGGMTNKMQGRCGDSPVHAASTYANNRSCAISTTGVGEQFLRHAVAFDVHARMTYKSLDLKHAVDEVIHTVLEEGDGGLVAVGLDGTVYTEGFNSEGMFRASADSTGSKEVKIWEY